MKIKILLFDDIKVNRDQVKAALSKALGDRGEVQEFESAVGGLSEGTYEDRLTMDLRSGPNAGAHLIVADRDLSGYTPHYRGLSEGIVRTVADFVAVPECGYARGERPDDPEYIKRGDQREACIRLSLKPLDLFATRVVGIADGFLQIREQLHRFGANGQKQPPGKLLARVLNKPEYADKIALYASGDQNRHRLRGDMANRTQQLSCLLGYWLWDSVLRFPGVTVGVIPAASYLNISEDVFMSDMAIQSLFSSALYLGPFASAKVTMWWRGMLDDIIAESGCQDGREFASKKLGREVARCRCNQDPSVSAGYYCMLKEKPVSLKNSIGGLSWFPRGADLARVSNTEIEELGPWI